MSSKDDIINSVISILTDIADTEERTKGVLVVRKYQDQVRPVKKDCDNCGPGEIDLYGEIGLERISSIKNCVSSYQDDGNYYRSSTTVFEAQLDIDFVGCGAWDLALDIKCKLEHPDLILLYVPEGIDIKEITDITDISIFESNVSTRERVTFSIIIWYTCTAIYEIPKVCLSLEEDECGRLALPIEII